MCGYCGCEQTEKQEPRIIEIEQDIMSENQRYADQNRNFLENKNISAFNFVSSPGSGKTTLLIETIKYLKAEKSITVIEGDQQTDRDANRIRQTDVEVLQINTGKSCHLDAHSIGHALSDLPLQEDSLLFIENVGNLVCPALFDLGEHAKVVILSVTEGDDKPLKYPYMFDQAKLMIINKIDLLPYVNFEVDQCIEFAKRINPEITVMLASATTGDGLSDWCDWVKNEANKN